MKTVTRHLPRIAGSVEVNGTDISAWSARELAKEIAVVLTDRVRPELVTCAEIVAMGRYPYTNLFGRLTPQDTAAVEDGAPARPRAGARGPRFLHALGRAAPAHLLARAICQAPQTIVLDEPTAYLDIRYKLELLGILREMAQEKHITVIMSLHEIDLAMKISDYLMCIKGETILAFGRPDDILREHSIAELYELTDGSYNDLFGSVELAAPAGAPQVFVVAAPQRHPVLPHAAKARDALRHGHPLGERRRLRGGPRTGAATWWRPGLHALTEAQYDAAAALLTRCGSVLDAGAPEGPHNAMNRRLLELAGSGRSRCGPRCPEKKGAVR